MVVIKVYSETPFNKKLHHIEIDQLICKVISLLIFIWYEFLLKEISEQIIVLFFFKDVLISKKQSNIDSLKISLTLPFRLNSSKWKTLYWVEYYVNCYVYFNCLLLQPWTKYLRQTLVFMWNSAKTGKVQFLFFSSFLVVLTKVSFWE